ncbi:MAG: beta-aspartyl-peptidase [Solirubrobacterales bacterium]
MLLFKNISLYSPKFLGTMDILTCYDKIAYISTHISLGSFPKINVIDGKNLIMCPGFIDLHIHFAGGGGEGGFNTRTPDLMLTDLTGAGITTGIGLLGTDGTTRSMGNLIAKARALEVEGISTYVWTGCYQVPTRTITDSPRGDIILVDKIIGIGEIAISDHRSSHPSIKDLAMLASEARIGGMISGKAGVLHLHTGDEIEGLDPVLTLNKEYKIPLENILPTHINRNHTLFNQAIDYAKTGGNLDITTGIKPETSNSIEFDPGKAFKILLENNVSPFNITMSSDAGGSMPIFDKDGKLLKLSVGSPMSNLEALKSSISNGIAFETAIIPFTLSPSKILKLKGKGEIKEGHDADLLIFDNSFNLKSVVAKGKIMVENYKPIVFGTFQ